MHSHTQRADYSNGDMEAVPTGSVMRKGRNLEVLEVLDTTGYVAPKVDLGAFHCPHCGSYSDQHWTPLHVSSSHGSTMITHYTVGRCNHCKDVTIWNYEYQIYPSTGNAPMPNPDMPKEMKQDYNEARDIVERSPRSACMLLRLCVEKICDEKIPEGGDMNEKIGKMVGKGLDDRIKKALDSVRVIGGEAVHALQMDLKDDREIATKLFKIVNFISQWAHTSEKEIDRIFDILPDSKKNAIRKRDNKK